MEMRKGVYSPLVPDTQRTRSTYHLRFIIPRAGQQPRARAHGDGWTRAVCCLEKAILNVMTFR